MAIKMHRPLSVHAGTWLKTEIVAPHGASVKDLAAHLCVSRQALSALLNGGARLTADTAIRFEKAFGVSADTLMRMQTAYDLARARSHAAEVKVSRLDMTT